MSLTKHTEIGTMEYTKESDKLWNKKQIRNNMTVFHKMVKCVVWMYKWYRNSELRRWEWPGAGSESFLVNGVKPNVEGV